MKINKNNNYKKIITTLVGATLVLTCTYLAYAHSSHLWPFPAVEQGIDTPKSKDTKKIDEHTSDTEPPVSAATPTTKPATQPESKEDASSSSIAKPNILTAKQINDRQVRVSANFSGVANGTCELSLSKPNETTIRKVANIIIVPGGYACDGFLVDVPSSGNWTAVVNHIHDKKQNNSEAVEVE